MNMKSNKHQKRKNFNFGKFGGLLICITKKKYVHKKHKKK